MLELCILSLLHRQDSYGYDLAKGLSQHIETANGTVYQILRRLTSAGLIAADFSEERGGHLRKYYSLTTIGYEAYQQQKQEWLMFTNTIDEILRNAEKPTQIEVIG